VISDLFIGAVTGQPIISVGIPIVIDGAVRFELATGFVPQRLAEILRRQNFPDDWVISILDSTGTIVARTRSPELFVGKKGTPPLVQKMAKVREGTVSGLTLEGIPVLGAFSRSEVSGWSVAIGIPPADLSADLRQTMWLIAIGTGILLAFGGLLVSLISRRIVRSIRSLQAPALALVDGRAITAPPSSVAEVDEVAQALVGASRERARLIREKEQIEARLARSQRLEALGQLTGSVAHDFGNLLNPILGMLELLAKWPNDPRSPSRLGIARAAAERAAKLVHSLLVFARQQPLAMARVDLNETITGMTDLLSQALGSGVTLRLELQPDAWPARADTGQLEMAILNLVVNARDAITRGGIVRIATANIVLDGDIDGLVGDFVVLTVSDTGAGMPPEILARAFEPLFTTKLAGKGTGLGLASLYGFAKQCGGTATIDSELGKGTTVAIYLPREQNATVRSDIPSATSPSPCSTTTP
jgi:signal transduction histidine kinase